MTALEQELLALAEELRAASDPVQLREIRNAVQTLAPRVSALDSERREQQAVRHLYNYLDVRSKAAVRDGDAELRAEHAEIERRLVALIARLRRVERSNDLDAPLATLRELYERVDALARGTDQRWMLERLYNYANWHGDRAEQRVNERRRKSLTRQRGTSASIGLGAAPAAYRSPTVGNRDRGVER